MHLRKLPELRSLPRRASADDGEPRHPYTPGDGCRGDARRSRELQSPEGPHVLNAYAAKLRAQIERERVTGLARYEKRRAEGRCRCGASSGADYECDACKARRKLRNARR